MMLRDHRNIVGHFRKLMLLYLLMPDERYQNFVNPKKISKTRQAISGVMSSMLFYYKRMEQELMVIEKEHPEITHIFFDRFIECTIAYLGPFLSDPLTKIDNRYKVFTDDCYSSLYNLAIGWGCHYNSYIYLPSTVTMEMAKNFLAGLDIPKAQILDKRILKRAINYLRQVACEYTKTYNKQINEYIVASRPNLFTLDAGEYPDLDHLDPYIKVDSLELCMAKWR